MKEFIIQNKKTLLICLLLMLAALAFLYLKDNPYIFNDFNYEESNDYLKNYRINEVTPININEEQMAKKYLAEYTKLIIQDPKRAYDLVEKDYCEKKFGSLEKFIEYFDERIDVRFSQAKVDKLSINKGANYKQFYIIDSSENQFIFREYSIMQYEVIFDFYTI